MSCSDVTVEHRWRSALLILFLFSYAGLASQNGVIHLAFFRSSGLKEADPMAGYRRRMAFRT